MISSYNMRNLPKVFTLTEPSFGKLRTNNQSNGGYMNSKVMNLDYGVYELRKIYSRYAINALFIAGIIHITLIAGVRGYLYFSDIDDNIPPIHIIRDVLLLPPPGIANRHDEVQVAVSISSVKPNFGIPVPIPDAEINPEATMPTQTEVSQNLNTAIGNENGTTPIEYTTTNVLIDPEPEPFTPVQKEPIPISNPSPTYPEIARKSGVEGTVWIKMWITKQGNVKRSEIVKSSSSLFDEVALDASRQWIFTPAIMNNGPVAVWVTVPFRFRLQNH
jgi:TonB family protein